MIAALFIPADRPLLAALQSDTAQRLIDAGCGLYTDGERTALLARRPAGWMRMAVKVRDLYPHDAA